MKRRLFWKPKPLRSQFPRLYGFAKMHKKDIVQVSSCWQMMDMDWLIDGFDYLLVANG